MAQFVGWQKLRAAKLLIVIAGASALIGLAVAPTVGVAASHAAPRPVNARIVENFAPFRRPRTRTDRLSARIRADRLSCYGPSSEGGPNAAAIQGLGADYQIQ